MNPLLLIASSNGGKIKEFRQLCEGLPYTITDTSVDVYNVPEPVEDGASFVENALLKARYYSSKTGLLTLADDSGLAIDALGGRPGIFSARYAGESKNFAHAFARLQQELADIPPPHTARFVAALALCWPDGRTLHAEGSVEGTLTFPPRGQGGFGYDPIFIPDGHTQSFAEMPELKKQLSHRARAFAELKSAL
jgi:XTP/dITP diphosphohydrolase